MLRSSLLSRWFAQPAEILQRSMKITPTSATQMFAMSQRQQVSTSQSVSQIMRRSLSSIPNSTCRATLQARLTPRSIRLPTQKTQRRFNSSSSRNTSSSQKEGSSLSERLRKLSREYGWAALGVYLTLSALDFPICFAAVQLLGVERIGHFEHVVVKSVKDTFGSVWPKAVTSPVEDREVEDDNLAETEKPNLEEASIWTQLALAYAIHKTVFIFVRVPLTAAVTPKVVQALRRRGWDIGKRKPKSP